MNATRRRGRADRAPLRRSRHRGRPRLRGPARAGDPRRRRQAAAGDRPRDLRPRRRGPAPKKLSPDEIRGGTFTISNNGSCGTRAHRADHQPAAGRHHVDRRRSSVARSWSIDADGGEAIAIHSVGNLAMSWDHRAFDGAYAAAFLVRGQGDPRDPRLGRRARDASTRRRRPLRVRWLGRVPLPRGARAAARRCSSAAPTTICCCSSTRTSTRWACGPTRPRAGRPGVGRRRAGAGRPRRRRHLPRARPARRLPDPRACPGSGGGGMADTVAYVRSVEQLVIDTLADLGLPRRRAARRLPGRVGRRRHRPPARSPPSACGSRRGRIDARLRPQRRRPTCRCSTTSCRAASRTRP